MNNFMVQFLFKWGKFLREKDIFWTVCSMTFDRSPLFFLSKQKLTVQIILQGKQTLLFNTTFSGTKTFGV